MKKVLAMVLAITMVLSLAFAITGCKSKNTNVVNAEITEYLVAEKVGTINRENFTPAEGGLYYKEDGKYGVMTHEGLFDTGAIFASCTPNEAYFEVSAVEINFNDLDTVNSKGLINGKGKVLIPDEYAYIDILNERYAKVVKASERVYNEADSVCKAFKDGDSAMYDGICYVYDIVENRVTLTVYAKDFYPNAYGNFIKYFNKETSEYEVYDASGGMQTGIKTIFDDGSYSMEAKVGNVFDKNNNKLFSYDLTGFIPNDMSEDGQFYIASKYVDGSSSYVVMDKKGNVVSAEFSNYIDVYGKLISCDDKVYNFEGKNVIEGKYTSIYYDEMFGQNWIIRDDKKYTMINEMGAVFYAGTEDRKHNVYTTDFVSYEEKDGEYYFYSFKDNAYTINGYAFAPWIVKTSGANYTYDLVDTMTGNKLLEGYKQYSYIARNSLAYYVYAKYEGAAEVYLIVSGAQLSDVVLKKNNLLDDLIAAFAAEGITVTIDKETGEMALDSSVLFGGDSAVLTDAGKTFLNKFIKVYTSIAFSDKYDGFITKTLVEGHTAPVAGSTYASGLQLSEDRANNVRNYCISKDTGVDVSKIANSLEAVGYSNSKPVYDKDGNVNMAASRRVSFRFLVAVEI